MHHHFAVAEQQYICFMSPTNRITTVVQVGSSWKQ